MYSGDPPPVFNLAVCESRTMINPQVARSLAGAAPRSFWLDQPDAPDPLPALTGRVTAGNWTPRCSPAGCGTRAAMRWSNPAGLAWGLRAPSTRGKVAGLTPAGHGYHEYPRSI